MDDGMLLEAFARLSQRVGADAAYVQGGGGNTSVKLAEGRMAIKASGGLLKDVTELAGYVVVEADALREAARRGETPQAVVLPGLGEEGKRPSMETGFHAVLGRFVLHTHNMYANVLTCAEGGEARLRDIWPDGRWVPYVTPGEELTLAVRDAAAGHDLAKPLVIFLGNHGVIVSAGTADEAWAVHEALTEALLEKLGMVRAVMPLEEQQPELAWMRETVLFPDQVIFTLPENGLTHTRAAQETFWVYAWIRGQMARLGLTPAGVSYAEIGKISGLSAEKYRMTLAR